MNRALNATRRMSVNGGFRSNRGTCSGRRFERIGCPAAARPSGRQNHRRYRLPAHPGLSIWPGGRGRAAISPSARRGHCRGRGNSTRSSDAPRAPLPHPSNRTFHPIRKLSSWTAAPDCSPGSRMRAAMPPDGAAGSSSTRGLLLISALLARRCGIRLAAIGSQRKRPYSRFCVWKHCRIASTGQ